MVAVPAFTYAADVWYTGVHEAPSGKKRLGSIPVTNKLISPQQTIARTITGALSTTAGHVLNVHISILPVDPLFQKIIHRAVVSGFESRTDTLAVLYKHRWESEHLTYHLGPAMEHTVYEAEIVEVTVGLPC
ncbi:hypothetical protein J132_04168 [Termitomyces sp. J132]|nr:hypothetical protein J132_04168 [Termitomyces sp. J132]